MPNAMAINLSPFRNSGNILLIIIDPKGMKSTTPEIVPGEYVKVKILNNEWIIPFAKIRVPNATNIMLFL
jgi:hypothetical protein